MARGDARLLILGSLPSEASIAAGEYYAHPQNAFWRIMRELVGAMGSYERRCSALTESRIALWDVLKQSVRPGSLDADIRLETAQANDFGAFLDAHAGIELICFNGRKAEQIFRKFVKLETTPRLASLPSTSPAHAAMSFDEKLEAWRSTIMQPGEAKK
ncbi:MAG: DNA-deoxyinosine glycosylase [Woeseiaceae bacterium]|nr:DNA-deoxyinosine glycosylase [Woeseiaceae bacterium]